MTVLIDNRTNEEFSLEFSEIIENMVKTALLYEEFDREAEVSVSIVTNEEIQQINNDFRNINRPTDVLSFPLLTFEEGEVIDLNENEEVLLGDIIISFEKAKEQANEYNHSLKREIAFLTVHSMLHLLGYDHMTEDDEKEMFAIQDEILLKANITR